MCENRRMIGHNNLVKQESEGNQTPIKVTHSRPNSITSAEK
jgi:hypothetical protein